MGQLWGEMLLGHWGNIGLHRGGYFMAGSPLGGASLPFQVEHLWVF